MASLILPNMPCSVLPHNEGMTRGHTTVMLLVLYTYIVLAMSWTRGGPSPSVSESEIGPEAVLGHPVQLPIVADVE